MKFKLLRILILSLLIIPVILASKIVAQDVARIKDTKYFRVFREISQKGRSIDKTVIMGPPNRPEGYVSTRVQFPESTKDADINVLPDVPAFDWSFGCSATSAAMIAGYYDRTGYPNMYTGPTNGGVMPMDNSSWPDWYDGTAWRNQCPLSATHDGLDERTIKGHVDDYWVSYNSPGPDPWVGNWTEHSYGDCTGDYMKTNQWIDPGPYNIDGGTRFYNYTNGSPLHWNDMETYGIHIEDGGYGLKLFYQSRGYMVSNMYNQYIYGYGGNTNGFTYAQYCAEIDAGHPVMIHIEGHTMVGVGYDNSVTNLMYIHDTWDYNTYTMVWGGSYAGMKHYGVTIVQLELAVVGCQSDFDGDGYVYGSDLVVFAEDFGRTDCSGDCEGGFDPDGDVDGSDLVTFIVDFGRTNCP